MPERDADARRAIAEAEQDPLEARDDVRVELREEPQVLELDEDRRRAAGTSGRRRCTVHELPGDEDRDRDGDLGGDLERRGRSGALTRPPIRCDGCQRSDAPLERAEQRSGSPRRGSPSRARARTAASSSPYACAKLSSCPRPGVPMKSSAVNARISATVDAIRSPVTMYGTALGSVIRHSRSCCGRRRTSARCRSRSGRRRGRRTSSARAAARTRRTPRGRPRSSASCPSVRKSSGISAADGIGRRNSIGTRNALRREVARAEDDPERHREHGRDAEADRPPAHGLQERAPELPVCTTTTARRSSRSSTGGLAPRSRRRAR